MTEIKDINGLQLRLNQLGEGLGTAYERYALNRFLEEIAEKRAIQSVLEFPANGVMGVPGLKSMVFALHGISVTLANPSKKILQDARKLWSALGLSASMVVCDLESSPFREESFDLCWNFCCFEHFKDPKNVVSEMKHCSKNYVLTEVQNIFNVGFILHSLYHRIKGEAWDHGERKLMDWRRVSRVYKSCGLQNLEVDGNDMPPWPDINMKVGELLMTQLDTQKVERCDFRPDVKTKTIEEIRDLWSKSPMENHSSPRMLFLRRWHDLVERLTPKRIRVFLCHHPYVIGVK